jgi:hypothetical protein
MQQLTAQKRKRDAALPLMRQHRIEHLRQSRAGQCDLRLGVLQRLVVIVVRHPEWFSIWCRHSLAPPAHAKHPWLPVGTSRPPISPDPCTAIVHQKVRSHRVKYLRQARAVVGGRPYSVRFIRARSCRVTSCTSTCARSRYNIALMPNTLRFQYTYIGFARVVRWRLTRINQSRPR